ncbi:MAG: cytochrome d ubiquinol oxidase subunit II [Lewinellaceae bacterium]|nr:cytochrome d ubiquinol oxidase subunit II [Lewinellaceae bacterium]
METFLNIDLRVWWFLVIGAVFTGYAILDGFDLGAGVLHLFFRKEESRRIALNAIGPVWDGNEVWLVIGGGALFAGFPEVYATVFSAFYVPFMLFVVALIFRAISIEFRSKEPMLWWRLTWDISYTASSILIAGLLGVLLGNLIQGIAIGPGFVFQGNTLDFINPYSLLTAVTTIALFSLHGAIYLSMKTEHRLYTRVRLMVKFTSRMFVLTFVTLSLVTLIYIPEMADKFRDYPVLFGIPAMAMLSVFNIQRLAEKGRYSLAFVFSGLTSALLLGLASLGLFPVLVPSTLDPQYSLTVYNAASSFPSLKIMLTIAAIGVPIVGVYTTFVFWTFRGKVKIDEQSY